MRLTSSRIEASPLGEDRARLIGDVVYQNGVKDTYWFDVRQQYAQQLSTSGNPFLAALLPLAVCNDEPLQIDLPVDRLLYENIRELMYVWKMWYPELPIVRIEADVADDVPEPEREKTASFFTGGVDSLFTALRHTRSFTPDAPFETDDLITICGYDIPLANADAYGRRYDRQRRAADALEKDLVDIYTNARENVIGKIREVGRVCPSFWYKISHACGLASLAYSLEKRFRKVIISSSYTYKEQGEVEYGTSPLTDHLLSSRKLNVFHYGSGFSRAEKVMFIAPSDVAMATIQVCFHEQNEKNCGYCLKCMQTMIPLEIAGALGRAKTFPDDELDLSRVEKLFAVEYVIPFIRELHGLAVEHGKSELADALQKSHKRVELIEKRRRLGDWLTTKPVLWRLARPLRRSIRKMEAESVVWAPSAEQKAAASGNGGSSN